MKLLVAVVFAFICYSQCLDFDDLNLYPRNLCKGFGNGKRFSVPYDCNQFIICMDDIMRIRKCPNSHPYFDSCTFNCDSRPFVCQRNNCDESGMIAAVHEVDDEIEEDES